MVVLLLRILSFSLLWLSHRRLGWESKIRVWWGSFQPGVFLQAKSKAVSHLSRCEEWALAHAFSRVYLKSNMNCADALNSPLWPWQLKSDFLAKTVLYFLECASVSRLPKGNSTYQRFLCKSQVCFRTCQTWILSRISDSFSFRGCLESLENWFSWRVINAVLCSKCNSFCHCQARVRKQNLCLIRKQSHPCRKMTTYPKHTVSKPAVS